MAKKKKLENLKKKHNQYIKSLGVNIDVDTGEIFLHLRVMIFQIYRVGLVCLHLIDIAGVGSKKTYATQIPAGKTISVAYNKGPYMVVDAKDFKTMGRKI